MAYLTLQEINKIYPNGFHAVHDFNLEIEKGEFIVLVGSSGCGKSTTLRMIAGLEDISKGELLLNGVVANKLTPRERGIAMVFQSYALYPQMTVYDNLAFGLTLEGVDEDEIDRRVKKAAGILGLTEYLDRMPRALSGSHAVTPWSSALALPLFAFAAAGVTVVGVGHLVQPVSEGVVAGLVVGKVLGVLGTTWLVTRLTPLRLPDAIGLRDLLPNGYLCGIGYSVALQIAELSYDAAVPGGHTAAAKVGILAGSLFAALLGGALLRWDVRRARSSDMNRDGRPDRNTAVIR